jgi:hypothetical protein
MKNKILKNGFGYLLSLIGVIFIALQFKTTAGLTLSELKTQPLFYIFYALTFFYFSALFIQSILGKLKWKITSIHLSISVVLLLINFILFNGNFLITSSFSSWLHYFFLLAILSFLLIPYHLFLPNYVRFCHLFFMGLTVQLAIYFTVLLFPSYTGILLTGFLFGFSLLGFVPLLLLIFILQFFIRNHRKSSLKILFLSVGFAAISISFYLFQWQRMDKKLQAIDTLESTTHFPVNSFTEKIIMGEFVYDSFGQFWENGRQTTSLTKKHHPLISIALFVFHKTDFSYSERIVILEKHFQNYDGAHHNVWNATIYKYQPIVYRQKLSNQQYWLIIFLFPILIILTFYKANQYDL